jgi:ATP-dependent protease ClpP protease subunit
MGVSMWLMGATHEQVKHRVAQLDREEQMWVEAMESFTKQDKHYWATTGKLGQDLFLNAKQCQAIGIIDEVF